MNNKEMIHVRGSARKQARGEAKRWNKVKRQNFVEYARRRNAVKIDAEKAETLAKTFVETYFSRRHEKQEYFDELLDALHTTNYLRELHKRM
jgi:hypothetical protein